MNLPKSAFAEGFRAYVLPRLKEVIAERCAEFLYADLTYGDIVSEVWTFAARRGVHYLPAEHETVLREWVHAQVSERIEAAERLAHEAEALVLSLMREPSREVLRRRIGEFISGG